MDMLQYAIIDDINNCVGSLKYLSETKCFSNGANLKEVKYIDKTIKVILKSMKKKEKRNLFSI